MFETELLEGPWKDIKHNRFHFRATLNGEEVLCAITAEALDDDYGAQDYIACFNNNQNDILLRAARMNVDAAEVDAGTPKVIIMRKEG